MTGLAFVSANLGAVEIMGMSANGAQIGIPTVHYFWIGAIPAMVFLGIVMMPFYYGSGVRSVPEFMLKRFGPAAHLVNAISFALAQLLIAGINLYLLGTIVHALLGWPLWVALIVAAMIVLAYISLGGLSAAIYNEVLQFFVIVASLLPLVIIGLHRVGGWSGLKAKITAAAEAHPDVVTPAAQQLHSWPGQALSGFGSPVMSVIGITLGLGFVLSLATGRRISSRCSGQWHPILCRLHARRRLSGPSRRCSCPSSPFCQACSLRSSSLKLPA